ncbi:hypothetical protein AAG906_029599 [Vitis piasezkii]
MASESPSSARKVVVHLRATGDAPILKQAKFKIPGTDKFAKVIEFLRRQLHRDTLFVYVNSAFSPNPDELVIDLYNSIQEVTLFSLLELLQSSYIYLVLGTLLPILHDLKLCSSDSNSLPYKGAHVAFRSKILMETVRGFESKSDKIKIFMLVSNVECPLHLDQVLEKLLMRFEHSSYLPGCSVSRRDSDFTTEDVWRIQIVQVLKNECFVVLDPFPYALVHHGMDFPRVQDKKEGQCFEIPKAAVQPRTGIQLKRVCHPSFPTWVPGKQS